MAEKTEKTPAPHGARYLQSMHKGVKALHTRSEKMGGSLEPEIKPLADKFQEDCKSCMDNLEAAHKERYKDLDMGADDEDDQGDEEGGGEQGGGDSDEATEATKSLEIAPVADEPAEDDETKSLDPAKLRAIELEVAQIESGNAHVRRKLRVKGIAV